jgi:hypothetical protein
LRELTGQNRDQCSESFQFAFQFCIARCHVLQRLSRSLGNDAKQLSWQTYRLLLFDLVLRASKALGLLLFGSNLPVAVCAIAASGSGISASGSTVTACSSRSATTSTRAITATGTTAGQLCRRPPGRRGFALV